jgi:hypothetical protein
MNHMVDIRSQAQAAELDAAHLGDIEGAFGTIYRGIGSLHGSVFPPRLSHFIEPGIQSGLYRRLILLPGQRLHELAQRAPGDGPHAARLACTHFGPNGYSCNAACGPPAAGRSMILWDYPISPRLTRAET